MYNELVKRLRDYEESGLSSISPYEAGEIADAIEQLCNLCASQSKDCSEAVAKYLELWAKQPRWIPVTERLPDNIDDEVLVCAEDYGKSGLGFVTVATYGGTGWLECWERKTYLTAVTHWMPLPEPPKEE